MFGIASKTGVGLVLAAVAALACAQDYPTKPITVVVPFAAGGPTDTVARLVAQSMTGTLKQQVIVENAGGAGGTIGANKVAKAKPDGYTLLLHHIGHSTAPSLYRKLPYDALDDFEPDRPHHRRADDDHLEEGLRAEGHEGARRLREGEQGQGDLRQRGHRLGVASCAACCS